MLYDPKWEKTETIIDKSLASFIAWLERQPYDGTYDIDNASNCAVAQWLRSMGCEDFAVPDVSSLFGLGGHDIILNNLGDETFGECLRKARAFAAR